MHVSFWEVLFGKFCKGGRKAGQGSGSRSAKMISAGDLQQPGPMRSMNRPMEFRQSLAAGCP